MTTFEERLREANLTPFKNITLPTGNVKQDCLKLLIKQLYKHQLFSNIAITQRINRMHYCKETIVNYASYIRTYLKTGKKHKHTPKNFYAYVDFYRDKCEAILQPSEEDGLNVKGGYNKKEKTPVSAETTPKQYGIKMDNIIKLFANKEACEAYIQCYKEFNGDKDIKIVTIKLKEV